MDTEKTESEFWNKAMADWTEEDHERLKKKVMIDIKKMARRTQMNSASQMDKTRRRFRASSAVLSHMRGLETETQDEQDKR